MEESLPGQDSLGILGRRHHPDIDVHSGPGITLGSIAKALSRFYPKNLTTARKESTVFSALRDDPFQRALVDVVQRIIPCLYEKGESVAEIPSLIIAIIFFIIVRVLLLTWRDRVRDKRHHLAIPSARIPLSDEEFCREEGLDSSCSELVSTIRSRVGKLSGDNPLNIYPDDRFSDLGLSYGDVEILMNDMDIRFKWEPSYVRELVLVAAGLRRTKDQGQRIT